MRKPLIRRLAALTVQLSLLAAEQLARRIRSRPEAKTIKRLLQRQRPKPRRPRKSRLRLPLARARLRLKRRRRLPRPQPSEPQASLLRPVKAAGVGFDRGALCRAWAVS